MRHNGREPREFDDDLWWSVGRGARDAVSILHNQLNFPGAVRVAQACEADDRNGVDYWVYFSNGRRIGVDVKLRRPDWAANMCNPKDDLTLEAWSVVEKRIPGWTRNIDKHCDYILFFWPDTGRWCLLPFRPLCAVFLTHWREWRRTYETNVSTNRKGSLEWHSEAVFVPRMLVLGLIEQRYGGAPVNQKALQGDGNA